MIYNLKKFLLYMNDINNYNTKLTSQYEKWENAKLLCEMNCPVQSQYIVPKMLKIQQNFYELQNKLINTLIEETLKKTYLTMYSNAQVTIDILMRNLFERTADVGFLATDDVIIDYILNSSEESKLEIKDRLKKYTQKYSVYHDIIIFDTNYKVLVNFDDSNNISNKIIDSPYLKEVYTSNEPYIEVYDETKLLNKKKGHMFMGKIYDNDNKVIGIICFSFKFENEMQSIFKSILKSDYISIITIIDDNNIVISSSDENNIPIGARLQTCEKQNEIIYYRGIKYLAATVKTNGYQGYFGLDWRAQIMVPLNIAFEETSNNLIKSVDQNIINSLLENSYYFSSELTEILKSTRDVNKMLRRFVYNGQHINSTDINNAELKALKPLFIHINNVGQTTKNYFYKSIKSLFATIISSSLYDISSLSSLCIDIMDRNLYERANDCRWWALDENFKEILSADELSSSDISKLTNILEYINNLYTVYANLFIFDKEGRIIAVSNPDYNDNLGEILNDKYIRNTLENSKQQNYYVSKFKRTKQYKNNYTYIYSASITNNGSTVGGIGIVFDSELQFKSMLEESLESKKDSFAVFINENNQIISSTNPELKVGEKWEYINQFNLHECKDVFTTLVEYNGAYYSMGCTKSKGYREYKNSNIYHNDTYAIVFEKLSQNIEMSNSFQDEQIIVSNITSTKNNEDLMDIAIFIIGGQYFAFEQQYVKDVIEPDVIEIPYTNDWILGIVIYNDKNVLVIDSSKLLGKDISNNPNHILIVNVEDTLVALQVDDVNTVIEITKSSLIPINTGEKSFVRGIVSIQEKDNLKNIIMLNNNMIFDKVRKKAVDYDFEKSLKYIENLGK